MLRFVRPSVSLSHAPASVTVHLGLWLLQDTNRKPMLEVEPTGERSCSTTESDRNCDEAVVGAASEAFARWMHRSR